MKKQLIVALGIFTLILTFVGRVEATHGFGDDNCGVDNPFVVDTLAEAARVANGYNCPGVDLTIKTSLDTSANADEVLQISAKTLVIDGPDVLNPASKVTIIHNAGVPSKEIRIAIGGNITIDEADIRAPDVLKITCTAPGCKIDIKLSVIIASSTLNFGDPGGRLEIVAEGDLDIQTTTTHGGQFVTIRSKTGSVVWICKPAPAGCPDPAVSPSDVIKAACGDPVLFPCTVTFPTAAELTEVCRPIIPVQCDGGSVEKHILAAKDIDIRGSNITASGSFRIFSTKGRLLASGAILSAENFNIGIEGDPKAPALLIDFKDAELTATGNIRVSAGAGCPLDPDGPGPLLPDVCINAESAKMIGSDIKITANNAKGLIVVCDATIDDLGGDKPVLNGDSTPTPIPPGYDPNVIDTAAECAPLPACNCL